MSTNLYSKLLNAYPHLCRTLATISASKLKYETPSFWTSQETSLPRHTWGLQIIAVWNTAARIRLNEQNPTWLTDLANDIPEAWWKHKTIGNDPILNARHPNIETGYNKFEKLPSANQHTTRHTEHTQEVPSPPDQSSWGLVHEV